MKYKVSELEGVDLDRAVARAFGWQVAPGGFWVNVSSVPGYRGEPIDTSTVEKQLAWSTDWSAGGPIIERERISLEAEYKGEGRWTAGAADSEWVFGDTPLVAAMRAFVTVKLGNEIDLP